MDKKLEKMTMEEKVDLLLKYHKSAHRWAMIGGIIKIIFFLVDRKSVV